MTHPCYSPENAGRLQQLRNLEQQQKRGLLKQDGYFQLLVLKRKLKIGNYEDSVSK